MFTVGEQDRYVPMRKDVPVCAFSYNLRRRSVRELEVFSPADAPWGASIAEGGVDAAQLTWWIARRCIPTGRAGLSAILRGAGCADPASLLFKSLALNLSDQYWIKPAALDLCWSDVNYFDNPYVDGHADWTAADGVHVRMGPGSAASGQLVKHWECREGRNVLVKGPSSTDQHEPWAELLASKLGAILMPPDTWVPYEVERRDGRAVSVCPCFADAATEFVPLDDVMRHFDPQPADPHARASLHGTYVDLLERLGIPDARSLVDRAVVLDFLTANDDRHEFNLGIMLDSDARRPLRVAPVFDNGQGFYHRARIEADLTDGLFPYDARVFDNGDASPLALVHDFSWVDFDRLRAFAPRVEDALARTGHPAWFAPAARAQFALRIDALEQAARER